MTIDYGGQKIKFGCYIAPDGKWRFDSEVGKSLLHVILTNMNSRSAIHYVPTHDDICLMLEKMLETELLNDAYTFKNPVNDSRRPPQIYGKIGRVRELINKYEKKAKEHVVSTGAARRAMDKARGHKYYKEDGYVSENESIDMWKMREKRSREISNGRDREIHG